MKVLWFTNTPCSASKLINNSSFGGWLNSLEAEINKIQYIELGICFYSYKELDTFYYGKTKYFPVYRNYKSNRAKRIIERLYTRNHDLNDIKKLLDVIDEFSPDLIHIHGTEENFGLIQKYTKLPIIISLQGLLSEIVEHYFCGIPINIINRYEDFKDKLFLTTTKRSYEDLRLNAERERQILKHSRFIIGRTLWDSQFVKKFAPQSIYFIGNEILRSGFYCNKWVSKGSCSQISIVSTLSGAAYKGFELIIEAAIELKKNSNFEFKWIVIGLNESDKIVKIVKKWKNVIFDDINVHFCGNLNEITLINELLKSDIFCLTSHIENSSNSLCEAMLLGLPIISLNVGGVKSLVRNRIDGILLDNHSPNAIANAILELSSNPEVAKRLSQSAFNTAQARHNPNKVMHEYLNCYEYVVEYQMNKKSL